MKKRKIKIQTSYEPNRLTKICLSDAYDKLILAIKSKENTDEKNNFCISENITNNLKGNLK